MRKIPYATGEPKDSARDWYCLKCKQFSQGEESKASSCQNKKCDPKERLPADYSVAQHLADACITAKKEVFPSNEFGFCNIDPSISFDVDAGRQLEDFLLAGRAFDRGQAFEGFARSFRHDWFLSALRARNKLKAAVGKRVEKECRKYADGITGSEIARLAHILNEQRLRITLSGYRNEKVVTEATEKIFDDCLVDKPYVRNG